MEKHYFQSLKGAYLYKAALHIACLQAPDWLIARKREPANGAGHVLSKASGAIRDQSGKKNWPPSLQFLRLKDAKTKQILMRPRTNYFFLSLFNFEPNYYSSDS